MVYQYDRVDNLTKKQRAGHWRLVGQGLMAGKSLSGMSWAHGYGLDDFVRDQEMAYQYRKKEERQWALDSV